MTRAKAPHLSSKAFALLAAPVCLAALAWSGTRYSAARGDLRLAEAQHQTITSAAAEIERLRNATPTVAAGAKPQPNISGQVTDTLVEAGLAPALLTNVTPESDTAIERANAGAGSRAANPAARYRRQSARLTLEPLTMPDLGRFLATWRTSQPQWTIASINVSPVMAMKNARGKSAASVSSSSASAADTTDDPELQSPSRPVRVNLLIECVYVDQPHSLPTSQATSESPHTSASLNEKP
jgi:hypothetical protein